MSVIYKKWEDLTDDEKQEVKWKILTEGRHSRPDYINPWTGRPLTPVFPVMRQLDEDILVKSATKN